MEFHFLGCGSAYNPQQKNTSAYCILQNNLIVFDCGETVFETLYSKRLLEDVQSVVILITHFHSDHIGSLGSMISYFHCRLKKQIYLLYPSDSICSLLEQMGLPRSFYSYTPVFPALPSVPVRAQPIPVQHDPSIACYGYLIEQDNMRIFYGGDSCQIPESILTMLLSGTLHRVYQDMTYEAADPAHAHGSLEELSRQVPPAERKKVYAMHFDHDFSAQILDAGFSVICPE